MGAYVELESEVDLRRHDNSRPGNSNTQGMVRISGGTFRMGSDRHYPEETPVHRVTVSDFWIDRAPITNRQFKEFVNTTRHVTFAEFRLIRKITLAPSRTCCLQARWSLRRRTVRSICATGVSGGLF
jgi:formylglycine-generating enzyme required for sulfatase activity